MKKKDYIVRTERFNGRNLDHKYFYFTSLYKAQLFVTMFGGIERSKCSVTQPSGYITDVWKPVDRSKLKYADIYELRGSMSTVEEGVTSGTEIMKDDNFTYVRKFDYAE